jgi:hypothetical protein
MPLKHRKQGDYRDVPVPTWLWEMVKDLPNGPLSPGHDGRLFEPYVTVRRRFARAADTAGIPDGFTPHYLRHAYASALLGNRVPLGDVAERLGHQDVTFATGATIELASNTINLDTATQMLEALDSAYLASPNCAWYMSPIQWSGLLRQVDAQKKALMDPGHGKRMLDDIPVVLTSQATAATPSTVSGPVLGDLGAAMTLRIVDGSTILVRSHERRAEFLEMFYRAALRADVQVRDSRAVVGVKYAAT